MNDYIIAIITRGRVREQIFLRSLPMVMRKVITIVCHPGEGKKHIANWGNQVERVIEYGKDCDNIGQARGWLMNYCKNKGIKYCLQIDDNVLFAAHSDGNEIGFDNKLLNIKNNYNEYYQSVLYTEMFTWMLNALRSGEYGIVGISPRSGNNRKKEPYEENTRLFAVWGINVNTYFKVGELFQDNPYKEDFHIQLAFLTSGIKTICNNVFTFDKAKGANSSGGCSIYRTLEKVNKGSILLKERFPDFVTIVEKKSNNWSNFGEDGQNVIRLETIIHWKKAYNSTQNNFTK